MARKLQLVGDFPSGELSAEEVKQAVDEYLEENPPLQQITINGEGPDENGNFVINVQPAEATSALTAEEVETIIQNIMQ